MPNRMEAAPVRITIEEEINGTYKSVLLRKAIEEFIGRRQIFKQSPATVLTKDEWIYPDHTTPVR